MQKDIASGDQNTEFDQRESNPICDEYSKDVSVKINDDTMKEHSGSSVQNLKNTGDNNNLNNSILDQNCILKSKTTRLINSNIDIENNQITGFIQGKELGAGNEETDIEIDSPTLEYSIKQSGKELTSVSSITPEVDISPENKTKFNDEY